MSTELFMSNWWRLVRHKSWNIVSNCYWLKIKCWILFYITGFSLVAFDGKIKSLVVSVTIVECPACVNGQCDLAASERNDQANNLYYRNAACACNLGYTGTYWVIQVRTGLYRYVLGYTGTYWVIQVRTGLYRYVLPSSLQ